MISRRLAWVSRGRGGIETHTCLMKISLKRDWPKGLYFKLKRSKRWKVFLSACMSSLSTFKSYLATCQTCFQLLGRACGWHVGAPWHHNCQAVIFTSGLCGLLTDMNMRRSKALHTGYRWGAFLQQTVLHTLFFGPIRQPTAQINLETVPKSDLILSHKKHTIDYQDSPWVARF
jgi:hypothetical protein